MPALYASCRVLMPLPTPLPHFAILYGFMPSLRDAPPLYAAAPCAQFSYHGLPGVVLRRAARHVCFERYERNERCYEALERMPRYHVEMAAAGGCYSLTSIWRDVVYAVLRRALRAVMRRCCYVARCVSGAAACCRRQPRQDALKECAVILSLSAFRSYARR